MKMNKSIVAAVAVVTFSATVKSQDPIVMTINDKEIKKSEFEVVYRKNNGKEANNTNKSVKEYVDLFSLYKSKVFEAESLGLDTLSSFKAELAGYRKQLAAPYLTDKNTNDNLLQEAYERMKLEVRASHILVKLTEGALPKDTLEAWTRIELIKNALTGKMPTAAELQNYERLLKGTSEVSKQLTKKDSSLYRKKWNEIKNLESTLKTGEDKFSVLASALSDDPSAVDNKGDLNYFSVLDMVYPFECAAYNTPVGNISSIVRTRFGYHILKVYDKRANRGEITVAHIMIKVPKAATEDEKNKAKQKIDEINAKLKAGEKFEELARQYSEDKQSSDKGGYLQPFKGGRMPKAFEDASFALKNNNDISEPVKSPYGWHIIKRIDLKEVPAFDAIKNELKTRVSRDSRSQMGRAALIERVKKENSFTENLKNRDAFNKILDSTYLKATWNAESAKRLGNKEIFKLAGKVYSQDDFAKFLETQMTYRPNGDINEIVKTIYKTWVDESVVAYEDSQLEKKYTDFANLYREYRDGILLFDLTDQKVWSKAVKDTIGLRVFYEDHKNNYLWDERAEVTTYKCANQKVATEMRKLYKQGKSEKQILEALNKGTPLNVSVENITYLKGENKNIDANWKVGIAPKDVVDEKAVLVIIVNTILPKSPKTIGECRGNLTADYQNYLDAEWLAYLKKKYVVKVNNEVLNTIK